ncbi:DUF5819 family protein [Desmospora activa]|uniref:Uncharacterized protein n=1 Tax=Desmospora activa DSM 45169 TaxID=1121389 RepID=A0A2T4Z3M8_9BACL|nr:DUF5819 family protein [Desmospora activa]PTM56495.1 hypothetical protein C8J48_2817 [Desmospora activa DSM 45169]
MRQRNKLFPAVAFVAITALTVHFAVVILSLTPDNPVKNRHQDAINKYTDPLFTQNWMLFAPNPVSQHRNLSAQARIANPQSGEITETEWVDITGPLIKEKQENRISSEAIVARHIISGLRAYLSKDKGRQRDGEKMLQRAASTALAHHWSDQDIREVRLRIITQAVPSFQERYLPDDSIQRNFHESDWLPFAPAEEEWPR